MNGAKPCVLIAGAGGFLGRAASRFLKSKGFAVYSLSRAESGVEGTFGVDYRRGELRMPESPRFAAVINFCGRNLAEIPWSEKRKRHFEISRVEPAERLAEWIEEGRVSAATLISASGVGFYGMKTGPGIDETAPKGEGFLADLCANWEAPLAKLNGKTRVVAMRLGVVLAPEAGFLARLAPIFKLGLGGKLGDGGQFLSWIGQDDFLHALEAAIKNPSLNGPVNFCSPVPVSNKEFTREFGKHLKRPAFFTVPEPILKTLLGEMAENLVLADQRAVPAKLAQSGFTFSTPNLPSFFRRRAQ